MLRDALSCFAEWGIAHNRMNSTRFKYQLRESPRGKNVRLRVTLSKGLEVYVPRGYDVSKVPALLERRRIWVRSALERRESQKKFFEPKPAWKIPNQISLPAVRAVWHLEQRSAKVKTITIRRTGENRLSLTGAVENEAAGRAALARWLTRETRERLVPRLEELSRRTGLKYDRISVRKQRTRWASCSKRRTISLNAKLLFLQPDVVDYVIVHELCHLAEMNHSKQFWLLLKSHCPNYRKLDNQLRDMWKRVPHWAHEFASDGQRSERH